MESRSQIILCKLIHQSPGWPISVDRLKSLVNHNPGWRVECPQVVAYDEKERHEIVVNDVEEEVHRLLRVAKALATFIQRLDLTRHILDFNARVAGVSFCHPSRIIGFEF